MENFTPFSALAGGALIGLSATALLFLNGQMAGVSGVLSGLLGPMRGDIAWRVLFLAGLVLGAVLFRGISSTAVAIEIEASLPVLIGGGLLVGFGTRMGGGCTSGHGVCGVARLSPRSIVATLVFLGFGMASVFVVRHLWAG